MNNETITMQSRGARIKIFDRPPDTITMRTPAMYYKFNSTHSKEG